MIHIFLLATTILSECIPIPENSICSPFKGSIDSTKLSQVYHQNITAKTWETIVREQTQGGQIQQNVWNKYYKCPSYKGELVQYFRSFVCMTDLFVYSSKCNNEKPVPLCPEVCKKYGDSVKLLISNCPSSDRYTPKMQQIIEKRRNVMLDASKKCEKIRASDRFDQKQQCVVGIQSDQESCGFAGNQNVAQKYCEKNPKSTCCTQLQQQPEQDYMNYVQRMVMMMGATSNVKEPTNQSTLKSTLIIIGGVCGGVVLIGVGIALFVRRRAKSIKPVPLLPQQEKTNESSVPGLGLRCVVKYDYQPNLSDEMELHQGDVIIFENLSDDAWGDARNLTTGEVGKACTRFMEPFKE